MVHNVRTALFMMMVWLSAGAVVQVASDAHAVVVDPHPATTVAVAQPIRSLEGRDLYMAYCAVCHGADGRGTGPWSRSFKRPVTDLTALARRNKGRFDTFAVQHVIWGEEKTFAAADQSNMPAWGEVLAKMYSWDGARMRVFSLVKYIEFLQVLDLPPYAENRRPTDECVASHGAP